MNAWSCSCPHCSECVCFETKKVSKGVVSQALKGFGCKLSKSNECHEVFSVFVPKMYAVSVVRIFCQK